MSFNVEDADGMRDDTTGSSTAEPLLPIQISGNRRRRFEAPEIEWKQKVAFNTPMGRNPMKVGEPATMRALRRSVAYPKKPIKVHSNEVLLELKKRAHTMGSYRQEAMRDFIAQGGKRGYQTAGEATNDWTNFLKNQSSIVQEAFGAGQSARKAKDYRTFGPNKVGRETPYYIENGILRGGRSFSGVASQHGAMHLPPTIQQRALVSALAKYVNPTMYPSTRVIKFIHGSFAPRKGNAEALTEFSL
jgi:hypothetical protein